MSLYDYKVSKEISKNDPLFGAIIMAAVRKADTRNLNKLMVVFPDIVKEFKERYDAPGGHIEEDENPPSVRIIPIGYFEDEEDDTEDEDDDF